MTATFKLVTPTDGLCSAPSLGVNQKRRGKGLVMVSRAAEPGGAFRMGLSGDDPVCSFGDQLMGAREKSLPKWTRCS